MRYILSADLGTTAFKAAVFDEKGRLCGSDTCEYEIYTPGPGLAEAAPDIYEETFRTACRSAVKKAGITPDQILSISLSTQGETTLFLDENMKPLRNAIVWFDTRALSEAEDIVGRFGMDEIQRRTGQTGADAIWPGAKILWLQRHEPENFRRMKKAVQLEGYISLLLTGRTAGESTILGSTCYFDINTGKYWPEMLDFLDITEEQLPKIVPSGTDLGHISSEAARRFGFSEKTTLNIGAIDLACGAIGAGNVRPGIFSESTGSALCTVTLVDRPVYDPERNMPLYCGAKPGQYMIHAYSTGGMMMRWFRDNFCELEISSENSLGQNAYDQLDELAEKVPAGSEGLIALPHLQGSGPPDLDQDAKGVFFGMTIAHGKGHFARAVMEGVAMVLCRMIEGTRSLGIDVDRIVSFSGGAKSRLWNQIKADASGLPVYTTKDDESAACLGTAILAGTSLGIWDSIEQAADEAVKKDRIYRPDPSKKPIYDDLLRKYKKLMKALAPVFKEN